ncbi:MAG: DUF535 family protein [Pseudomonadota bacterium]
MQRTMTHFSHATQIARSFGLRRALTFWLAAARAPEMMHGWLTFLDQHMSAASRDGLVLRVLRPYMRQHFTAETKHAMLRSHYEAMAQHFVEPAAFAAVPGVLLATLGGKTEGMYTLHLGGNTSKEGELAFIMRDGAGHALAALAGTIGADEQGQPVLWIGGLQGAKPPIGRDEIVFATRDLFGLRPKGAVLLAAQTFCRELGLGALRAPGNEGHISQRGFRRLRSKRKIYADYGQFWDEVGGTMLRAGEYLLPIEPLVRDVSEVKRHKRSEWKKRQVVSEALTASVAAVLTEMKRG